MHYLYTLTPFLAWFGFFFMKVVFSAGIKYTLLDIQFVNSGTAEDNFHSISLKVFFELILMHWTITVPTLRDEILNQVTGNGAVNISKKTWENTSDWQYGISCKYTIGTKLQLSFQL